MVKIYILNDNRCSNKKFDCEHGLSLLIEQDNKKILFDAGQTDVFIRNADLMGVDINTIDSIVLSHGDYDHGNGLKYFPKKVNLVCHPDFMKKRISKRTGHFDGLNQSKEEFINKFNLIETNIPYNITDNIIFLGEIEKIYEFEDKTNLPMIDEAGKTYHHFDDSGIVVKEDRGIIVISGCAHSGICNTIEYAKKITRCTDVIAVIGGFHLKKIDLQTDKTIQYMIDNKIKNILLAHCTSDEVCEYFKKKLPKETTIVETGNVYMF